MADLITRAAAKFQACNWSVKPNDVIYDGIKEAIKSQLDMAPAVDAVPVVRCRDCRHCFNMDSDPLEPYDGEAHWYCDEFDTDWNVMQLDPNRFYCANGEKLSSGH